MKRLALLAVAGVLAAPAPATARPHPCIATSSCFPGAFLGGSGWLRDLSPATLALLRRLLG